jgi:hypothetical protein
MIDQKFDNGIKDSAAGYDTNTKSILRTNDEGYMYLDQRVEDLQFLH